LNPDSAVEATSPKRKAGPWSSECVRLRNFEVIFTLALRCYQAELAITKPLLDVGLEAVTHRLRCGRVAPCASLLNRNCGIRVEIATCAANPLPSIANSLRLFAGAKPKLLGRHLLLAELTRRYQSIFALLFSTVRSYSLPIVVE
jgi:hypothetical protein